MKDTSFYVTEKAKQPRIAEPLQTDRSVGPGTPMGDLGFEAAPSNNKTPDRVHPV